MKSALFVTVLVLLTLAASAPASAQNTQDFGINFFDAQYTLSKDSKNVSVLSTNEYIQAQFPDIDQNHGILRALPLSYNGHSISLLVSTVDNAFGPMTPATSNRSYATSDQNGNRVLKIGDAGIYVHGTQNYHIGYSSKNVTRSSNGYDELFWNVNGTQWQQTMQVVHASLKLSPELANSLDDSKAPVCFTGTAGSVAHDCTIDKIINVNGSTSFIVTAKPVFNAGENLSFAIAFKQGTFAVFKPSTWARIQPIFAGVMGTGIVLTALFLATRQWQKYGRDPKGRGTIVPEYQPPKESSLLMHEYVLHENGRPVAITAQIINLAIRGYVRILDTEKDKLIGKSHVFSLEQLKAFDDLAQDENQVATMIFGPASTVGTVVSLDSLKNKLSAETALLWKTVGEQSVSDAYFVSDPKKAIGTYISIGIGCFVVGFGGFFFGGIIGIAWGVALTISGVILLIVSRYMPARTLKGLTLHDYLLGLKLYIQTAEIDRIAFHQGLNTAERTSLDPNDPAQKVKLFELLLPYAMLFGLEKDWGNQFKDIYSAPPAWYGGTINNFSTGYLLGGLSGLNSAANTSFSPPASSGSSGFSGGSSGGGGGGGGGGGW